MIKRFLILTIVFFTSSTYADHSATHGMVIFGTHQFYASHLPLFHSPHDYQVIVELSLPKNIQNDFRKEQVTHPENVTYTLEPENFILPEMIASPRVFKANLYRGHFERGGELIFKNVPVTIEKVIYFKKLDPTASVVSTEYLIFGNSQEQFAVHMIHQKPSFDHISYIDFEEISDTPFTIKMKQHTLPDMSGNIFEVHNSDQNKVTKLRWLKQIYLEFTDLV